MYIVKHGPLGGYTQEYRYNTIGAAMLRYMTLVLSPGEKKALTDGNGRVIQREARGY